MIDLTKTEKKPSTMVWYIFFGVVFLLWLYAYNLPSSSDTPTPEEIADEYGASLSECLEKADIWLTEAKQSVKETLKDEENRGMYPDESFKQTTLKELTDSVNEEYGVFKKECRQRFQ